LRATSGSVRILKRARAILTRINLTLPVENKSLIPVAPLVTGMNQQLKRFENHAQLIRHIHEQSGVPKDELWKQLNEQL